MILALLRNRLRECYRRPFPYVAAIGVVLLAAASRAMLGFSFGAETRAAANLIVSAVFLAGLLQATFVGTALVNRDIERGTFGFLLTKPLGLGAYLLGTFVGLVLCAAILCVCTGMLVAAAFALTGASSTGPLFSAALVRGCLRALFLVFVLDAAALAASSALQRVAAPLALIALFVLSSLAGASGAGGLLPSFELFALDSGATASSPILAAYALLWCAIFLVLAYIVLSFRTALRANN